MSSQGAVDISGLFLLERESKSLEQIYDALKGIIRAAQRERKCPKCKKPFVHRKGVGIFCPECQTVPRRFMIRLKYEGKTYEIYCDKLTGDSFTSYRQAFNALQRINQEIEEGVFRFEEWKKGGVLDLYFEVRWEKFLEGKEVEARAGNIAESYLKQLKSYSRNHILPFWTGKIVKSITRGHIEDFKNYLFEKPSKKKSESEREGLSKKTISNILNILNEFFRWLEENEWISRVPSFPKIRLEVPEIHPVSWETQVAILEHIKQKYPEHYSFFLFLFMQAVRPGEAGALQWRDLDLEKGEVTIRRTFSARKIRERTKSGVVGTIPLRNEVWKVLLELRRERRTDLPSAFVFRTPRGALYKDYTIDRIWGKIRKDLNLPEEITCYNAGRHTTGTLAFRSGADAEAIRRYMRHSDIRMTKRYIHAQAQDLRHRVTDLLPSLEGEGCKGGAEQE